MDSTNVIIKPLITEKSTHQQNTRNAYTFQVHHQANKYQIKSAVESLYEVKVADVRTITRKGKPPSNSKTGTTNASELEARDRRP